MMRMHSLAKLAYFPLLLLLTSCGQDATIENGAAEDEAGMSSSDAPQDRSWMPAGVVLPEPHTVLQDTKIGTRTHLLQVSVPSDPQSQFAGWKTALETAGYTVNDSMLFDGRLLFDGANVESGQISVSQPEDVQGYMIQIDVTVNG